MQFRDTDQTNDCWQFIPTSAPIATLI